MRQVHFASMQTLRSESTESSRNLRDHVTTEYPQVSFTAMASTDISVQDSAKTVPETQVYSRGTSINLFVADCTLRVLLFASAVTGVVVMVTSNQTEMVPIPMRPGVRVSQDAKFNHSPAFIYLLAALCVACLHSILTTFASARSISKPAPSNKLLFCLAFTDLLMAGIVASATGAAAAVAYIGLWGNSHSRWMEICPNFDKFCRHMGSSIGVSLAASNVLILLIMLSTYSLYRRSR